MSYLWDFGSGLTGRTGRDISKDYDVPGSYVVTLTVTDDAGETGVVEKTVTVAPLAGPTAVMSISPAAPNTTTAVFFDARASTAPSPATISSYSFNFGDGTGVGPTTSPTATHTFAATGIYGVLLTVTDGFGRSATTTVNVPVIAASPIAVLTISPQDPRPATTVFFDGSRSSARAGNVYFLSLQLGDGTVAGPVATPTTTHAFTTAATYVVRLTVTDSVGRSATTTATVTVRSP